MIIFSLKKYNKKMPALLSAFFFFYRKNFLEKITQSTEETIAIFEASTISPIFIF